MVVNDNSTSQDSTNEEQKPGFLSSLNGVDVLRQVTLILVLAICLAIGIFTILWMQESEYRPLGKMETDELIQTLDFLDQQKIDYRIEGDVVSVPEDQYQDIRLQMKRSGLTSETTAADDILLTDMGFGVSQRVESERLKYSREQTLARTIEEITSVQRAKVLLAIPKQNVFARNEKKPSATVVLTMKRGKVASSEEVDSVVDIVASAVQGLEPTRVTVTDQNGRLLNSGSQNDLSARSRKEYEIEQKRETAYLEKIDSILIPVVGLGNYTAQVDVTMDFTMVEQTQKRFNPDLPAVRSEMTIETDSVGGINGGIPGALSNQPPLESNIPEQAEGGIAGGSAPGKSHREATRNYELDTTISHTRQQTGVVRRLSVSVAVDYIPTTNEETGETDYQPRNSADIANIRRLLQGGLGFDTRRGDTLEVVTVPFMRPDLGEIESTPFYQQAWFNSMIRLVLGTLVIIVLIWAVVRPILRKLIHPDAEESYSEESIERGVDLGDETIDMLSSDFDASSVGFNQDGTLMLPDLHKDEDVLKAVRALVANEPILSAQVVKAWLNEDA
nr:flagellar basal-body MS-ring/collar protein FliF [Gayadomonas joobiniege]